MRNNEVYGDMTAWIAAHAGDNESDLMRLKRNLRLAREEELTARQRELLRLRYEENMTVTEIAAAIGRDKSTVSRRSPARGEGFTSASAMGYNQKVTSE